MFSFFKRNKSRNSSSSNNNSNNDENANKASVNMQLAIERQQASLHQVLEQKRKIHVNDREQKDANSYTARVGRDDDRTINRSTTLDRANVLATSSACVPSPKHQNYDQHRDSVRATYVQYDSIEYAGRQGTASPVINSVYQPSEKLSAPSVVAVTSPIIKDQKCSPSVVSSSAYNSVYEAMGRGRNRNKHRGPNNSQTIPSQSKVAKCSDERNVDDTRRNSNGVDLEPQAAQQNPLAAALAASAVENSEKSASISCENVPRDDENSCSIISRNDNIAASEGEANIAGTDDGRDGSLVAGSCDVKSDEPQQVGVPLQRNPSAKRVTFAPSPPRSVASSSLSLSDDEEEETMSEEIFYEAEAPNETQKLRILSTVTSHSMHGSEASSASSADRATSNDVVCAKIILSVDENERNKLGDNGDGTTTDSIKTNAFSNSSSSSGEETSISDEVERSAPKTIKPSYLLVGEDSIALPDIVAETSLCEQHYSLDDDDEK